jgi:hypothetical protein
MNIDTTSATVATTPTTMPGPIATDQRLRRSRRVRTGAF